jgi:hypothetical protein
MEVAYIVEEANNDSKFLEDMDKELVYSRGYGMEVV